MKILQKMISHFNVNVVPKLRKYKNYYDDIQAVLNLYLVIVINI